MSEGVNITKQKPELKTLTCEKHGSYEEKCSEFLNKWIVFSTCEKCNEEERLREEKEEREEIRRLRIASIKSRKTNAGISARYLETTFDQITPISEKQKHAIDHLKTISRKILEGEKVESVILSGGVGTGKTMICSALIDSIVSKKDAKIIKCVDLVRKLKSTWHRDSEKTEEQMIQYFTNIDLLIIDEVGIQFGSDTEKMFIFDIIDGRYENLLPTILISNLPIDKVKDFVGERVIDRLRDGGGKLLVIDGDSARK